MKRGLLPASFLVLAVSGYRAVGHARYWAHQELSPFHQYLKELDARIPPEARVLLVAPDSARFTGQALQLNTALYPRVIYLLPPGVQAVEEAAPWIAEKKITWLVSLGGPAYDPRSAYFRKLDDASALPPDRPRR